MNLLKKRLGKILVVIQALCLLKFPLTKYKVAKIVKPKCTISTEKSCDQITSMTPVCNWRGGVQENKIEDKPFCTFSHLQNIKVSKSISKQHLQQTVNILLLSEYILYL